MATVRHYTKNELYNLRDSPLVQKPDNLPAIEQWLEYVYADPDSREKLRIHHSESQQNNNASTNRRQQTQGKTGGGDSPMGSFSTGVRPGLMRGRTGGDDVSLGPPRTMFPSSRNVSKVSDFAGEKGDAGNGGEHEEGRSRFFGDKANRKSGNEKDAWTTVRDKRRGEGEEGSRFEPRFNRRDRDQDGERRNGHGEKTEGRWGERRQNGDRTSWRDREQNKRDKPWERDQPAEKEPEWMDDPAPPSAEDDLRTMGMPRNQEQFQKWKEAMSGKKSVPEEAEPTEPPSAKEALPAKTTAPLKLEGIVDKPFGSWGEPKTASAGSLDNGTVSAKSAASKGKSSRFASMFNTQPKEEPQPEVKAPAGVANGSAEDEAGFNRILQMLGGTSIGPPQSQEGPSSPPPVRNISNGTKQKSRFTGFFDQTPKSPERIQSPPDAGLKSESEMISTQRSLVDEPNPVFGSTLPGSQPPEQSGRGLVGSNPMSPEPMQAANASRDQQQQAPQHQRMNDIFLEQPPSRGTASPDINIQNLIAAQRAQRSNLGQDKNSEFLLNLLQTKATRPPSQQARQDSNFPLWLEQPPNMSEPHAPKPRAPPPPGLFEDQLLRNTPQEQLRQDMPRQMPGNEMPHRRTSQRAPPGFYDEQAHFLQQQQQQQQQQQAAAQQRRAFAEAQQQQQQQQMTGSRRMSGHPNLAQMQIPNQQHFPPGPPQPPPDFLQSPTGAPGPQGPPPGFHPQMPRHPPGLHNSPNIFQAPQQQQSQPPLQLGRGEMPAGFPGMQSPPSAQMQSPSVVGAPPGFFGGMPPGFDGMQMRSPTEGGVPGGGMRGQVPFDGTFDGRIGGLSGGAGPPQQAPRR